VIAWFSVDLILLQVCGQGRGVAVVT